MIQSQEAWLSIGPGQDRGCQCLPGPRVLAAGTLGQFTQPWTSTGFLCPQCTGILGRLSSRSGLGLMWRPMRHPLVNHPSARHLQRLVLLLPVQACSLLPCVPSGTERLRVISDPSDPSMPEGRYGDANAGSLQKKQSGRTPWGCCSCQAPSRRQGDV